MPRVDWKTACTKYGLSDACIRLLPSEDASPLRPSIHVNEDSYQLRRDAQRRQTCSIIFQESDFLQLARKVHGGDVGIAYLWTTKKFYSCRLWNLSEPQDDTAKRGQLYLRSLMYDRGIAPPVRSVACDAFVESGQGDPKEIVEYLDGEDWFLTRTNYYLPNKAGTRQVKLRLLPDRRQTRLQELSHGQKGDGGEEEEEEEDGEWYKLLVLNNWLQARLEDGLYQSYKLDPKGPETPPESIWPLIDRIDMGHTALVHAAGCIVKVLEDERRGKEFGVEELKEFGLTTEQISEMIDRMVGRGRGSEEVFMLSALLEEELGDRWDTMVVQRVKNLLQSHLS